MDFRVNVIVHGLATGLLLTAAFALDSLLFGLVAAAMVIDGVRGLIGLFPAMGKSDA